jgi:hypothetical protein
VPVPLLGPMELASCNESVVVTTSSEISEFV